MPRKNLALISGNSLLRYTAEAALASKKLSRVVLSTDDQEIAEEARACGIEVPFMRPAELARDETPTLPVLQHAVKQLESEGEIVDAVCILQPTHPFRTADDIDLCIELLEKHQDADSAMTIAPVPAEFNPHWTYFMDGEGSLRIATGEATPIPRRQELPPAYHREGSVYVTRRDVLMSQNSIYGTQVLGLAVDPVQRVNIDTMDDFLRAETLMKKLRTVN